MPTGVVPTHMPWVAARFDRTVRLTPFVGREERVSAAYARAGTRPSRPTTSLVACDRLNV